MAREQQSGGGDGLWHFWTIVRRQELGPAAGTGKVWGGRRRIWLRSEWIAWIRELPTGGWGLYSKAEWLDWVMSEDTRRREARDMDRMLGPGGCQDRGLGLAGRPSDHGGALLGGRMLGASSSMRAWNCPGRSPLSDFDTMLCLRIRSCEVCGAPAQATVCPMCGLPCCRACQNLGHCCTCPAAEGGRLRLARRRQDLPPDRAG